MSDEFFISDPVYVTVDIVLANDNAPVVTAALLDQVSPSALHLHQLINRDCSRIFGIWDACVSYRPISKFHNLFVRKHTVGK